MRNTYDVLVIGPVSLDHNIDYQGNERKEVGGAVVASGFAAARSGNRTALFTKLNPADADVEARFRDSGADLYWKPSAATCSIRNQYFTADKETRSCTSLGVKLGGGLGTAIAGWLLAASGFDKNLTVQPESCMQMLYFMYLWIPLIINLVITLVLSRMNVEAANEKLKQQKQKEDPYWIS